MNHFCRLCSPAGRNGNPFPTRFLVPHRLFKNPSSDIVKEWGTEVETKSILAVKKHGLLNKVNISNARAHSVDKSHALIRVEIS
jgi:hypothetical protein